MANNQQNHNGVGNEGEISSDEELGFIVEVHEASFSSQESYIEVELDEEELNRRRLLVEALKRQQGEGGLPAGPSEPETPQELSSDTSELSSFDPNSPGVVPTSGYVPGPNVGPGKSGGPGPRKYKKPDKIGKTFKLEEIPEEEGFRGFPETEQAAAPEETKVPEKSKVCEESKVPEGDKDVKDSQESTNETESKNSGQSQDIEDLKCDEEFKDPDEPEASNEAVEGEKTEKLKETEESKDSDSANQETIDDPEESPRLRGNLTIPPIPILQGRCSGQGDQSPGSAHRDADWSDHD